ncbi:MAG: glycosyltransferase family 87 protein [Longimicrobiales bacterium]
MMENGVADPGRPGVTDANAPGAGRAKAARLAALGLAVIAAVLAGRLLLIAYRAAADPAHGFVSHYTASRLVLEGADISTFYDDARMTREVQRFEPGVTDFFGANPPTMAFTAMPVAWLDYSTARLVWTLLSTVVWLAIVFWLGRTCRLPDSWVAGLVALAALFQPALEHARHAQFHVVPVLLLVLVAWRTLKRRPRLAGASLAAALVLKTSGLLFWPLLIARRRWQALDGGIVLFLVALLASLPVGGAAAWVLFGYRAAGLAQSGSLSVTAYQTLHGLVRRLTVTDPQWNPSPAIPFEYGAIAGTVLAVVLLIVALILIDRRRDHDLAFAAISALSLALMPHSLDYHYVLAIFPIAVLLSRLHAQPRSVAFWLLALATFLIAADLPYRSPRLADGVIALIAYPKLYGALLLAGLALLDARAGNGPEKPARQTRT